MRDDDQERLGRRHPVIVRLRALRRDPALRRSESVLIAEGVHLAQEALASRLPIETVVTSQRLTRNEEGRRLLRAILDRGLACSKTSDAVLDSVQDARSPQPVVMIVRRPSWTPAQLTRQAPALIAVAHGIQDPGNLGSLIRTAEAAGAGGCLLRGACADPFHPRTVRASAGSILRLPVLTDDEGALLDALAADGVALIATDPAGGTDYDRCDLSGPVAICFGAEGAGLPTEMLERAERTLRVPLHNGVESLSVPAAAAVVLLEAARQRRVRKGSGA